VLRLTPFDEWFPANVLALTADCREPMRDIRVGLELDAGPVIRTFLVGPRHVMGFEIASWLLSTVREAGGREANVRAWARVMSQHIIDDCRRPTGDPARRS